MDRLVDLRRRVSSQVSATTGVVAWECNDGFAFAEAELKVLVLTRSYYVSPNHSNGFYVSPLPARVKRKATQGRNRSRLRRFLSRLRGRRRTRTTSVGAFRFVRSNVPVAAVETARKDQLDTIVRSGKTCTSGVSPLADAARRRVYEFCIRDPTKRQSPTESSVRHASLIGTRVVAIARL